MHHAILAVHFHDVPPNTPTTPSGWVNSIVHGNYVLAIKLKKKLKAIDKTRSLLPDL